MIFVSANCFFVKFDYWNWKPSLRLSQGFCQSWLLLLLLFYETLAWPTSFTELLSCLNTIASLSLSFFFSCFEKTVSQDTFESCRLSSYSNLKKKKKTCFKMDVATTGRTTMIGKNNCQNCFRCFRQPLHTYFTLPNLTFHIRYTRYILARFYPLIQHGTSPLSKLLLCLSEPVSKPNDLALNQTLGQKQGLLVHGHVLGWGFIALRCLRNLQMGPTLQ